MGGGHRQPPSRHLVGAPLLKTAKGQSRSSVGPIVLNRSGREVTQMQYVYSTVYAAAGGGDRESIYNDYRLFENRLLSKKCMKFSILARFGDLFFLERQKFFDADGGDFWAEFIGVNTSALILGTFRESE